MTEPTETVLVIDDGGPLDDLLDRIPEDFLVIAVEEPDTYPLDTPAD